METGVIFGILSAFFLNLPVRTVNGGARLAGD